MANRTPLGLQWPFLRTGISGLIAGRRLGVAGQPLEGTECFGVPADDLIPNSGKSLVLPYVESQGVVQGPGADEGLTQF